MSSIGNVRALFTANAGGLVQATGAAGAALKKLGVDLRGLGSSMQALNAIGGAGIEQMGPASEKAEKTFRLLQGRMEGLAKQLQAGTITADEYAASMARVNQIAVEQSSLMQRGAAMTREHRNAFELFDESLAEADRLLAAGAISEETYQRAVSKLNKELEDSTGYTEARAEALREAEAEAKKAADALATEKMDAARAAEQRLSDAMRDGVAVLRSVETAEERHARTLSELNSLLLMGAIDHQTFARAVDKADDELRQESAAATKAADSTDKVASAVGRANGKLSALVAINAAQLLGSMASAASNAARSLMSWGDRSAEAIDQTSKLAARVGLTYGELQALKMVEDDISFETIVAGATKLDIAFVRAAQGSAVARAAFAGLGLSVEDLQGTTAAERMRMVSDAIAALPTEAERAAAAVRIFGKSGAELVPLFNQGAGAIAAAEERAKALGLALNADQTGNVQDMKDAFEGAGKAVEGIVQQVVAYLSPAVTNVMNVFTELVGTIGGANIGQTIGEGILAGAQYLAGVGDYLIQNFGSVFGFMSSVGEQWNSVVDYFNRAVAFLSGVFNTAQAGLGLIVLAFSGTFEGLAKIAQSIGKFLRFDTSSIDTVVSGAKAFNDELAGGIRDNMDQAGRDFATAFSQDGGNEAGQAIAGPLSTALDEAVARARQAASATDQAKKTEIGGGQPAAQAAEQKLTAVDSRSKEGVAEMFRLMRGGDDIQERQLDAMEQIAENTADMGFDVTELEFAR